ncbi:apelin [Alligator mississippiensis]|uniref:Apelin n=1 Tax=Alligator mississippiensis TaxID=8496 RepID=A0A151P8B7_ALLMI|nr:apelin [Alligator mississippiensis]
MGVRRWLLALLLLWLAVSAGCGGPLAEAPDGKDPEEGNIRNLVAPCLSNTGLLLPPPTLLRPITVVLPAS